jgi:hypothetical protein
MERERARGGRCCGRSRSGGLNGLKVMWIIQILGAQRNEIASEVTGDACGLLGPCE